MIYFTEIARDKKGDQGSYEVVGFMFNLKELPESIKFPLITKVNHIEYAGGFHTNQIIGIFPKEIEWEGCFYGTYVRNDGAYSAKERSDEIKKWMGRPIRVGFAVPQGADEYVPGVDHTLNELIGKPDNKLNGIVGVYIIEEYDTEIFNYSNVNYRIKLTPHMRQEKIKPVETEQVAVKLNIENAKTAVTNISRATKSKKKPLAAAAKLAARQGKTQDSVLDGRTEIDRGADNASQKDKANRNRSRTDANNKVNQQGPTDIARKPRVNTGNGK